MLTAVILMTTHLASQTALTITSPSFRDHDDLAAVHGCEGKDESWALAVAGVPAGAKSLALVVHDPDAPDPKAPRPQGWTHWVLYGLPPSLTSLPAGVSAKDLPKGALQGKNDWQKTGFRGPCPPVGKHRYVTTVYALDVVLPDLGEPTRDALLEAMDGHVLAKADLVGLYAKHK